MRCHNRTAPPRLGKQSLGLARSREEVTSRLRAHPIWWPLGGKINRPRAEQGELRPRHPRLWAGDKLLAGEVWQCDDRGIDQQEPIPDNLGLQLKQGLGLPKSVCHGQASVLPGRRQVAVRAD